jgi:prepilin-type N-terminal cleavage/methylation domain-containing protein
MKLHQNKTPNGFTLIELLVSMVITTIIISVLVTVTVTSLDIWNRNRAEVRASLQAKAMVDSMAADFESMVVRRGNNFQWLSSEFALPTDGPNNNANPSPSALNLIFFSAATDRYDGNVGPDALDLNGQPADKGGDISGIGYQLVYKDPISELSNENYKTFVLYRKLVNPDETFNVLLGKDDLELAFAPYAAGGATPLDAVENFVCENVYQFTVKFNVDIVVDTNPDPNITTNFTKQVSISLNDTQEFVVTGNGITTDATMPIIASVPDVATAVRSGRLSSVEVSLTVLTDGALKQLKGRSFSTDKKLDEFIAANSYQYSKLIPVPSY